MKTILSTKKLKLNQRELLLNAGVSVVAYDAIEIRFVDLKIESQLEHLIITSQNGAKAILNAPLKREHIKCYCVGEKTTALLVENGFKVVETETSGVDLGSTIAEKYKGISFHYLCGNQRRDELPALLEAAAISCNEIVVYETHLVAQQFEQEFDAILFFSPSGVTSFVKANNPMTMLGKRPFLKVEHSSPECSPIAVCIGETTAAEAKKYFKNVIIANSTTVESVIAKAVKILNS